MLLLGNGGAAFAKSASSTVSYNSVQINIQTTNSLNATYIATAYNASGYMMANSQSAYPSFVFELPSSTYLFTVTALQEGSSKCYPYAARGSAYQTGAAMILPPCFYSDPKVEYGYALQRVTSTTALTITTQQIDSMPTSNVTIQVKYLNGTATSGAYVSAYLIGEWYYWGNNNKMVLWAQTDKTGKATLVVPSIPIEVSTWVWLPVNIPKSQTTVQTTVGGEKVNVTVYWQPTYIGLAGSALLIPPTNSASITLHAQEPNYWVMPYGVKSVGAMAGSLTGAPTTMGTIASAQGGVPAEQASQYQYGSPYLNGLPQQTTPPLQITPLPSTGTIQTPEAGTITLLSLVSAAAVGIASVSVVVAVRGKK